MPEKVPAQSANTPNAQTQAHAHAHVNTKKIGAVLGKNSVPIFFLLLSIGGIIAAGLDINYLINELLGRLGRNSFLVLSLLIPIIAGLGLNFGIVVGAMAGQAALIITTHYGWTGLGGFGLAALISVPIAMVLGWLTALVLNKAKGREMVTGMILGFFANGVYQLVFLVLLGWVIPMKNPAIMLPSGIGLKNTIDLFDISYALDRGLDFIWDGFIMTEVGSIPIGAWRIPILTLVVTALLAWAISFLIRTRLGQQMRAVGQDMHIAEVAGINVNRTRTVALVISTVLAAWGQLIFLQNIGTMNTYNSHEQVGTFAIAALLVGGATTRKATIWNAIVGVLLFHTLFIVSPLAGQKLLGIPQVGEYFRVFLAYGVIAVALALHAWQAKVKSNKELRGE
ncbi:MAG TPA: ABC transporter permease [Firmicutes bacterium]|nr:ABC transporter permease [Bacillota bacterium]